MNNIRNNKGITLLSLIVTVVILVILVATAITASVNISGSAKFENVQTSLLLIQSKCKIMGEKFAIGEIKEEDLYGEKQTEGEYSGWYLLTDADLYDMGLRELKAEDGYYVNYETDNVAYGIGISYEGQKFYKLSEMKEFNSHTEN